MERIFQSHQLLLKIHTFKTSTAGFKYSVFHKIRKCTVRGVMIQLRIDNDGIILYGTILILTRKYIHVVITTY